MTAVVALVVLFALSGSVADAQQPQRGQAVFQGKGACENCHRVRGRGSRVGPDLSDIGAQREPADLRQSIVEPGAVILPQNRFFRATKQD